MKTQRVIDMVKKWEPTTPEMALVHCKFPLQYLGEGAYRHTFHILGTNLVIKFPLTGLAVQYSYNKQHAKEEYRVVTRIIRSKARKYKAIKKHMPKIYLCDKNGVMIATKYKLLPESAWTHRARLSDSVTNALNLCDGDLENSGNVGVDGRGTLKILDGGYLGMQG
jgi:hypothetical protein